MPNGELAKLLQEIRDRLTEGGTQEELDLWFDYYDRVIDMYNYYRQANPTMSESELEDLALSWAKFEWSKEEDTNWQNIVGQN